MNPVVSLLGIAMWALVPGYIAKSKGRSFFVYFSLSFIITPLLTTIIALCLSKVEDIVPQSMEGGVTAKESGLSVFDNQRPNADDYGISIFNPICIDNLQGEKEYLQLLRTPAGESFTWKGPSPARADCNGVKDVGIDKYQLLLNGKNYKDIFFVPYTRKSSFPPSGLVFVGGSGTEERKKLEMLNKTPVGIENQPPIMIYTAATDDSSSTVMNEQERKEKTEKIKVINREKQLDNTSEQAIFCRECGLRLSTEAVFCPECGAKVIRASTPQTNSISEKRIPMEARESKPASAFIKDPSSNQSIDYLYKNLSNTLRRAFILVEDGEWEKAESYFEKVLDDEPENAFAYVGQLLVKERAHSINQLSTYSDLLNDKLFQRAMRFANDDLKQVLEGILPVQGAGIERS